MKSCLYFSLVSSVMFYGLAYGACTPSPDCASLGYTATSCPNGGVKCPFDTSKWHCNECGADYKYDCKSANETGGVGTACDGKYASCNCSSGYAWSGGVCMKTVAPSGNCCNDSSVFGCSNSGWQYDDCKQNYGYDDCSAMMYSCRSSGGMPRLLGCKYYCGGYNPDYDIGNVELWCDY